VCSRLLPSTAIQATAAASPAPMQLERYLSSLVTVQNPALLLHGQAVIELQRVLPKARVFYVSATGATDPENLL